MPPSLCISVSQYRNTYHSTYLVDLHTYQLYHYGNVYSGGFSQCHKTRPFPMWLFNSSYFLCFVFPCFFVLCVFYLQTPLFSFWTEPSLVHFLLLVKDISKKKNTLISNMWNGIGKTIFKCSAWFLTYFFNGTSYPPFFEVPIKTPWITSSCLYI